jgi:hypothetical protein
LNIFQGYVPAQRRHEFFLQTGEGKKMDHAVLELPPYQSLDGMNTKSDSLGGVLRAREIVQGFGPEDFALLDAVFQAAWHHIEIKCVEGDRKASRERLASVVVALAQARGVLESEALEKAAVEMFDRRP